MNRRGNAEQMRKMPATRLATLARVAAPHAAGTPEQFAGMLALANPPLFPRAPVRSAAVFQRPSPEKQIPGSHGVMNGFALVMTLSLMILLTVIVVGLLSLASIELRKVTATEARTIALANARIGLMLALGQLQSELGDDRRITADGSILKTTQNPAAVGVWTAWSPNLAKTGTNSPPNYATPKSQKGFRSWLVSATDFTTLRQLSWHATKQVGDLARLFTPQSSGFELSGEKIPITTGSNIGSLAWAITQENTKARINIGTDDAKRVAQEDQLQTPSRPNLSNSANFQQPAEGWPRRPATVCTLAQAAVDHAYGASPQTVATSANDYTASSYSLLTNVVTGGLKTDLNSGFEMQDADFSAPTWTDKVGKVSNPFYGQAPATYQHQQPLYQPLSTSAEVTVFMDFPGASVNHKYQVNGVPTFDTLRSYYRMYRHLYTSSGGISAFERPYSHIASPKVAGTSLSSGVRTQPSLAPVLDRMNIIFSIFAKADGTFCLLLTPFVTVWNPYNIDLETEGLVVYPWIDFAMFWNWRITEKAGPEHTLRNWLSGVVGPGRSTRPYFYLHLTQPGASVIRLAPGEVRLFCLADPSRRDFGKDQGAAARTWKMKPVSSATDITSTLKGGIILSPGSQGDNYKLKSGDTIQSNTAEFDREHYHYFANMADSYQIKHPDVELMVEDRAADGSTPFLPAEKNLYFYDQIHAGQAFGGYDTFTYPSFAYDLINESPLMVGSLLTYHRVAQSSTLPLADLMFTTNPRQPFVNQYLSGGARFQAAPHYESLLQGGATLAALNMETTMDGTKAFYGPSHSAFSGKTNLAFFEVPRSPTLSLGSLQHCDLTASAFGCASQIGNSWVSPYLDAASVSHSATKAADGITPISPKLDFYDVSYLANEALFDSCYFSGAVPVLGSRQSATGSPAVWKADQISTRQSLSEVLSQFFSDRAGNPLANPRMTAYQGGRSASEMKQRLGGPAGCVRLAGHLLVEGGFNVNSTSVEAWTAVLSSLRGVPPVSSGKTIQSRFRHILTGAPANMTENDPWSGFRSLSDDEVKLLASKIVLQIQLRGPFLSLGEFVNRQVSTDNAKKLSGAIQCAIDASKLNDKFSYSKFDTSSYPYPANIPNPKTGTNTPGWLTQADVLNGLAPYISPRSDSFIIRSLGEAKDAHGNILASVRLEAVVQRVPDWLDPTDDAATPVADLTSEVNKTYGRRFQVVSIRQLILNSSGNPI